jgi:hypothetical protein
MVLRNPFPYLVLVDVSGVDVSGVVVMVLGVDWVVVVVVSRVVVEEEDEVSGVVVAKEVGIRVWSSDPASSLLGVHYNPEY